MEKTTIERMDESRVIAALPEDYDLVEMALESQIFWIEQLEAGERWSLLSWDDAPFALHAENLYPRQEHLTECWGLGEEMSLEDALADYDYLSEHAKEIFDALGVKYEPIPPPVQR